MLRLPNEEVAGNSLSETLQDSDDIPAKSLAENGVEREWGKGVLESRLGSIEWLPSKNKLSDTWNPEDENEANSILGETVILFVQFVITTVLESKFGYSGSHSYLIAR